MEMLLLGVGMLWLELIIGFLRRIIIRKLGELIRELLLLAIIKWFWIKLI